MKKFLFSFLLLFLGLALSGCNLNQDGSIAVGQPTRLASPSPLPSEPAAEPPGPGTPTTQATEAVKTSGGTTPAARTPAASAATAQAATAVPAIPAGPYPASPVDVVQAFVTAYPDQTAAMTRYLSAAMRAALPKGGPGELLKVQGDINGFSVLSGSAVPNPPQAVVIAAIEAGGARVERTFNLVQEKGLWVIIGIK